MSKVFPVWLALPVLILALGTGIFTSSMPWVYEPIPLEDTIPVSATMTEVEGDYKLHSSRTSKRWVLRNIFIEFEDHERLIISSVIGSETLLEKLEAYPAGTVFDMQVEPNGIDVMTLSVDGEAVLTYEAACRAIRVNNYLGIVWGIFCLVMAGYAAWSLVVHWRYRRLR